MLQVSSARLRMQGACGYLHQRIVRDELCIASLNARSEILPDLTRLTRHRPVRRLHRPGSLFRLPYDRTAPAAPDHEPAAKAAAPLPAGVWR